MKITVCFTCFLCSGLLLFLFFLPSSSFSQDLSLLETVKNNESLCNGNVDIISFQGKGYLVSVGRSFIEGDTPEANLKAGEQAKLTAEERLMKFVYQIQISSNEELKESTEITSVNGKETNRTIKESYLEMIREQGKGILKRLETVGKWKSKDQKEYFYAVSFRISDD